MRLRQWWIVLLAGMLAGAAARGTTIGSEERGCPVCGKKVLVTWIASMTIGGRDADLCPHAIGASVVGGSLSTCDRCNFTGYPEDFKLKLTAKQKQRLRAELKPMWKIPEGSGEWMPRTGRCDLVAQVYTILGRDPLKVANAYLMASWSVRLAGAASGKLPPEVVRQAYGMEKELRGLVAEAADEGAALLEKAKGLEGDRRRAALILAMDELRRHGDFEGARRAMDAARPLVTAEQHAALVKDLEEDIRWSRHFQKKAADLMAPNIGKIKEGEERAASFYLCGELYRRCGEVEEARELFRKCRECGPPQGVRERLDAQEKLLPAQ